jgi:hypothetical protein
MSQPPVSVPGPAIVQVRHHNSHPPPLDCLVDSSHALMHAHTHGDSFILESIVIVARWASAISSCEITAIGRTFLFLANRERNAVCRQHRGRSRSLPLSGRAGFPFRFIPQHGMSIRSESYSRRQRRTTRESGGVMSSFCSSCHHFVVRTLPVTAGRLIERALRGELARHLEQHHLHDIHDVSMINRYCIQREESLSLSFLPGRSGRRQNKDASTIHGITLRPFRG